MLENMYKEILKHISMEEFMRDSLQKTPKRAAQAMEFLTQGYNVDIDDIINGALFDVQSDEMIVVKNIEFYSLCEHHLLPFFGYCHVGYIPNVKALGLSKIPRIVDVFSRRLQMQENLTSQIASCIDSAITCQGVGVIVSARHMCSMMRGVEKQSCSMVSNSRLGSFKENHTWQQFINNINIS